MQDRVKKQSSIFPGFSFAGSSVIFVIIVSQTIVRLQVIHNYNCMY